MPKALILSGGGRYSDPWHPFAATSIRLAEIGERLGLAVEIAEDLEARLVDLHGVDVVVADAASGPVTAAHEAAVSGMHAFMARGGGILAVHVGASTLIGMPDWEDVTGMAWIDGVSMHPALGPAHVDVHPDRHAIAAPSTTSTWSTSGTATCGLPRTSSRSCRTNTRARGSRWSWARRYGNARIVTDALGHGVESFDSPEHIELILRSFRWLTGTLPDTAA